MFQSDLWPDEGHDMCFTLQYQDLASYPQSFQLVLLSSPPCVFASSVRSSAMGQHVIKHVKRINFVIITGKGDNYRCIATWSCPSARQSFSAL